MTVLQMQAVLYLDSASKVKGKNINAQTYEDPDFEKEKERFLNGEA